MSASTRTRLPGTAPQVPGYGRILQLAWPIILANSAGPLLGIADTAVIGNTGTSAGLGAIALGGLILGFIYWGFSFLRMGTTGFIAAADGLADEAEIRAACWRSLLLGLFFGSLMLLLQWPLARAAFALLGGSAEVEILAEQYFSLRIWGAPAALGTFALMGVFIGLGRSGYLLVAQLFLNGLNIALDLLFAGVMGWGVAGIAVGTAIAEWAAFGLSLLLAWHLLRSRHHDPEAFVPLTRLTDWPALLRTLRANSDIMLRTLFLLFCFAWFINQGARFGDQVLAANHVLLQLVAFSAFFLDGFANAVEPLVGRAASAGRPALFTLAVHRSSVLAALTAITLSLLIVCLGDYAVAGITDIPALRLLALDYLPYCAIYVLLSFAAFQLDGIFIGTGSTADMRNTSIISATFFLLCSWPLTAYAGNAGLWLAFILYVVVRAITLALRYPALRERVATRRAATAAQA